MSRQGLAKEAAETLEEYAFRIAETDLLDRDQLVSFLRAFASVRYAPFTPQRGGPP